MDNDHFLIAHTSPQWRRAAGSNRQHSIAFYSQPELPIPAVIVVTGYNLASSDPFMANLAAEFPAIPIIFNSSVGSLPPGSEGRDGPGWRILQTGIGEDVHPLQVPFDDLADSGLELY